MERGEVEAFEALQKRRRSDELGRRMIRVGVIGLEKLRDRGCVGLLELVETEVEGPNSVDQRRRSTELVLLLLLWFSLRAEMRGEVEGEDGEVDEDEEPRGSEPSRHEIPNGAHLSNGKHPHTQRQELLWQRVTMKLG